jgi:type IV secretory pathway TraG/TraD family ATPase VirD4
VEEIPSDPQIRNLIDPLSSKDFQEDLWFLLDELKEQQRLSRFRNALNTYAIALDGVSFFFRRKSLVPSV